MSPTWERPALDDLAEYAHSAARRHASTAVLVRIFALGLDANGRCRGIRAQSRPEPSLDLDYISRWEFAYFVLAERRWFTLSWLSAAYGIRQMPHVDTQAGNCSETLGIKTPVFALPSSAELAMHFASEKDGGWRGTSDDALVITHSETDGDVVVATNGFATWRRTLAALHKAP